MESSQKQPYGRNNKQLNHIFKVLKSSFTSKSDLSYTCSLEQKNIWNPLCFFSQINKSAKKCHNKFNKKVQVYTERKG